MSLVETEHHFKIPCSQSCHMDWHVGLGLKRFISALFVEKRGCHGLVRRQWYRATLDEIVKQQRETDALDWVL